jgi:MFS family permease
VERKWWTLAASCIAIFMLLLDVTIVNVALPSIERDLGANFSDLQWVIDAYALTLAGFVLASGSLADMVGRRLVFMLGLAIFSASSLACELAPDPLFLSVSRAAQGIGAAIMFGTSLALIAQEFRVASAGPRSASGARRRPQRSRSARLWAVRSWTRCRGAGFFS